MDDRLLVSVPYKQGLWPVMGILGISLVHRDTEWIQLGVFRELHKCWQYLTLFQWSNYKSGFG